MTLDLYADGGVIGRNPSPWGGTFAALLVDPFANDGAGGILTLTSGIVTPADAGSGIAAITNNYTELLAAVRALDLAPSGWRGTLYTDSWVTLCRIVRPRAGFAGIPDALQAELRAVKARAGRFDVILLDGHPTLAQLAAGVGKRGNPVSKWNVECDRECGRLAAEWKANNTPTLTETTA